MSDSKMPMWQRWAQFRFSVLGELLSSPPVAIGVFLALSYGFYRFGGWSLNSLKIIAHRPITAMDKLADFVTRFTRNAGIFGQWKREMEEYLAFVRDRTDGREI